MKDIHRDVEKCQSEKLVEYVETNKWEKREKEKIEKSTWAFLSTKALFVALDFDKRLTV